MGIGSAMGGFAQGLFGSPDDGIEGKTKKKKVDLSGGFMGALTQGMEKYLDTPNKPTVSVGAFTGNSPDAVGNRSLTTDDANYASTFGVNDEDIFKGMNVKNYDIPELYHGEQTPNSIVTHRTAGHGFHTPTDSRALTKGLGAHYTVDREGVVHKIGKDTNAMWHAGPKGNKNSIGIEVTGRYDTETKEWEAMTPKQKEVSAMLGSRLAKKYGIASDHINPHYQLANKSGTEGKAVMNNIKLALGVL